MTPRVTEHNRTTYVGRRPPAYLERLLTKIGGQNMFGEPSFRLVWAPHRLTPSGGTWVDWPTGTSVRDRRNDRVNPLRRVVEVRMIKRYGPAETWMLEKWVPPTIYGSPRRWYSPALLGGTMIFVPSEAKYIPSQGAYPSRGDYEYTGFGYSEEELGETAVIGGMQLIKRGVETLPTSPYTRLWQRTMVAEQAQRAVDASWERWALDVIDSAQPAFKGAPMSGSGRKGPSSSEIVARRLGFKEQV